MSLGEATATAVLDYPVAPNPKQAIAHTLEVDELLFGGAAAGGKTDYLIAEALAVCMEFPGVNVAIFRRTYPELSGLGGIELRMLDRIPQPTVGTYNAGKRTWTFANGSKLELCHCEHEKDVTRYQGREWGLLCFDQLEHFTEFQYRYLLHRLRVSGPVMEAMEAAGYRIKAISSANPGGLGHTWVKARFIDPFPLGMQVFRPAPDDDDPDPGLRVYVPSRVEDNEENVDAGTKARLDRLPEDLRRAMRDGDWNVYAGQRFRLTPHHIVNAEDMPIPLAGITRGLGVDYGIDAPFCALWGAKLADDLIVVYRELYTAGLTPDEQAKAILEAEAPGERRTGRPVPTALDPSCWIRDPSVKSTLSPKAAGPPRGSIAWRYMRAGVAVRKANNDRLSGVAAVDEALRIRHFHGKGEACGPDCRPRLVILSNCRHLIRTLPALPRDKKRPEDVDTKAEDHAYDALRYLVMLLLGLSPAGPADRPKPPARYRPPSATRRPLTAGIDPRRF